MTRSAPPFRLLLRFFLCLATALLLTVALTAPARADVAPPAKVLSRFETSAAGNNVSRDCGFSKKLPGSSTQSLWLFCDSSWSGTSSGFWLGATAAVGAYTPGQVPTTLTEIPTPPAAIAAPSNRPPAGFLPVPSGLVLPDGTTCQVPGSSYGASWISGVAQEPSTADTTKLLITYADVCVHANGLPAERFGLVEYKPSTNALSGQTQVFTTLSGLPFQKVLGSPIFSGGYLYLFGYVCDSSAFGVCAGGRVTLARVTATQTAWRVGSNYRYWNGTGWSANYADAQSVLSGAKPIAVHVEDFSALGKGFVLIEQPDITGAFRVWRSTSLTSGWTITRTGNAPCGGQAGLNLCRAYFGHPELSTSSNLLMSYYDPSNDHVGVMAVPW
ncbi:hypothetical protein ACRYCC_16895 [Actinomadura scrupuli]|uniref:hypothetical protein n=1 Tax=Actinomadura scrupuli TaxID=559629 RepID=UPI003D990943